MCFLGREAARKTISPGWLLYRGFRGPASAYGGLTSMTPGLTSEDAGSFPRQAGPANFVRFEMFQNKKPRQREPRLPSQSWNLVLPPGTVTAAFSISKAMP
jgi:hypothetical protein